MAKSKQIDVARLLKREFGGRAHFQRRAVAEGVDVKFSAINRMCDRRSLSGAMMLHIIDLGRKTGREIDITAYTINEDNNNESGSGEPVAG